MVQPKRLPPPEKRAAIPPSPTLRFQFFRTPGHPPSSTCFIIVFYPTSDPEIPTAVRLNGTKRRAIRVSATQTLVTSFRDLNSGFSSESYLGVLTRCLKCAETRLHSDREGLGHAIKKAIRKYPPRYPLPVSAGRFKCNSLITDLLFSSTTRVLRWRFLLVKRTVRRFVRSG